MASVASQLIEEVIAHAQSDSLEMRERYAQTVLTFRITYVIFPKCVRKSKATFDDNRSVGQGSDEESEYGAGVDHVDR